VAWVIGFARGVQGVGQGSWVEQPADVPEGHLTLMPIDVESEVRCAVDRRRKEPVPSIDKISMDSKVTIGRPAKCMFTTTAEVGVRWSRPAVPDTPRLVHTRCMNAGRGRAGCNHERIGGCGTEERHHACSRGGLIEQVSPRCSTVRS